MSGMSDKAATRRRILIAASPTVPPALVPGVAARACLDAVELAADVRDLDPREVWGRLAWWAREEPLRLYAVTAALAAMVPVDQPAAGLLAWTEAFAVGDAA